MGGGQGDHPFHSWCQANSKTAASLVDKEDSSFPRWQKDSLTIRNRLGVSPGFAPFTGHPSFVGYGLPKTRRVHDLLDCFVISDEGVGQALQPCDGGHVRDVHGREPEPYTPCTHWQ